MACEKLLDVVSVLVPQTQDPYRTPEDQTRVRGKFRKGKLLSHGPCGHSKEACAINLGNFSLLEFKEFYLPKN